MWVRTGSIMSFFGLGRGLPSACMYCPSSPFFLATTGNTTYAALSVIHVHSQTTTTLTSSQFPDDVGCVHVGIACAMSSPSGDGYCAIDRRSSFSLAFDTGGCAGDFVLGFFAFPFARAAAGLLARRFVALLPGLGFGVAEAEGAGEGGDLDWGFWASFVGTGGASTPLRVGLCVGVGVCGGSVNCRGEGVGNRLLKAEFLGASTSVEGVSLRSAASGEDTPWYEL